MATVFKKQRRRNWVISWYDHTGRRREKSSGTTDKWAAERIAAKLDADAELRREGVIDTRAEELTRGGMRPVAELLEAFRAKLEAGNRSAQHVGETTAMVQRICAECGFEVASDLAAMAVTTFLAEL